MLRENSPISTDSDLARLICEYVHNIPTIAKVLTTQDVIDVSIMKTVVSVGNILLENRAILLPSIHETFMGHVTDTSRVADISLEDTEDVSSRYILSSLTASLQHHITYSCKVRKYGTLVHRPNADLVPLLSEALWKLRMTQSHQQEKPPVTGSTTPPPTSVMGGLNQLDTLVQNQISSFLSKGCFPFEHDELDFNGVIEQIDPKLWEAICILTRSKTEQREVLRNPVIRPQ